MDAERRQALITEELERCTKVLKHYAKEKEHGRTYMHRPVLERFVADCFAAHEPLLERWGGWRWHTAVDVVRPLAAKQVAQAWDEAVAGAAKAGVKSAASTYPKPRQEHRLWRYRVLEDEPGLYDGTDYVEAVVAPIIDFPLTDDTPVCPAGTCPECDALRRTGNAALEDLVAQWLAEQEKNAPSYNAKVRPKQSVTKAVRQALAATSARCSTDTLSVWDRFFERLGQLWSAQRTWRLTLSCAPSSFLKLGHYGENSCYACWGGGGYDKLVIGAVPSSVVLLMYQGEEGAAEMLPDDGKPIKGAVSGRAWGWVIDTPQVQGVAFQNVYNVYWEQAETPLLHAVAQYFGRETPQGLVLDKSAQNWCAGYGTYSNNDAKAIVVRGDLPGMHREFGRTLAARRDYDRYKKAASHGWKVWPEAAPDEHCTRCLCSGADLAVDGTVLHRCTNCERPICARCAHKGAEGPRCACSAPVAAVGKGALA